MLFALSSVQINMQTKRVKFIILNMVQLHPAPAYEAMLKI